jgi:flagellin-like hook-associated protein FlgL
MSLVIGTNVSALYSQNALKTNARSTATTMERLSTGVRVNSAKDDAAGLAIGQNMTSQIRGLNQAVRNINDGINLVQTAEGGLSSVSTMLQRMRELAVQAANGTYSDVQREYLNKEYQQLQTSIGQVVDTTMWNDQKLLDGSFSKPIQIGSDTQTNIDVTISETSMSSLGLTREVEHTTVMGAPDPTRVWSKLDPAFSAKAMAAGIDGSFFVAENVINDPLDSSISKAMIIKYDADGTRVWTQLIDSSENASANALTIGADGSIYVAGAIGLSGYNQPGNHGDAFFTKIDGNGTKTWTKIISSGASVDSANLLSTGADGVIYVAGVKGGSTGFWDYGIGNAFIKKYDPDGTELWAKTLDSSPNWGGVQLTDMATGTDGALYIAGVKSLVIAGRTMPIGFLAKYDSNGTEAWTQLFESPKISLSSITIGTDGLIYGAGVTDLSLDGQTNQGNGDAFVTKFDATGTKIWTKLLGNDGSQEAAALTTGTDGSIYVAGGTQGSHNLDGQTPIGESDAFIAKFDADGTKVWTRLLGSSGWNTSQPWRKNSVGPTALITGTDGSIYIGGVSTGPLESGQTYAFGASANNYYAAFIAKYSVLTTTTTTTSLPTDISTMSNASETIGLMNSAIDLVNTTRATLGSYINRLAYAADNVTNISSNAMQSRSTIIDADYAIETTSLAKNQIIQQAATAMLAQANTQPQAVMALLKNL